MNLIFAYRGKWIFIAPPHVGGQVVVQLPTYNSGLSE